MSGRPNTSKKTCANGCDSPAHRYGLCSTCNRYQRLLTEPWRPGRTWPLDELMDEWVWLREHVTFEEFAPRVGMKFESWERAFHRAKAAGDPRAVRARNDPAAIPDPAAGLIHLVDPNRRRRRSQVYRERRRAAS